MKKMAKNVTNDLLRRKEIQTIPNFTIRINRKLDRISDRANYNKEVKKKYSFFDFKIFNVPCTLMPTQNHDYNNRFQLLVKTQSHVKAHKTLSQTLRENVI